MAAHPSVKKRQREAKLRERKAEKEAKRADRVTTDAVDVPEGVDPDLIGIVPGPQPIPVE